MLWKRIRYLQAPADGTGEGGGSVDDKADAANSDPGVKDPAGGEGSPDSKQDGGDQGRKSVLGDSGADQGDGSEGGKDTPKQGDKDAADGKTPEPVKVTLPDRLPDGVTSIDKEFVTAFEEQATKLGLDSEEASGLVAWYLEQEGQRITKSNQELQRWSDEQHDTLKKDPEFGGKNWDESLAAIQKVNQQFGKKYGLSERLKTLQLDNDPAIAKTLAAIGRALSDDRATTDTAPGDSPATKEQQRMDRLFPSHRALRKEMKE